MLKPYKTPRRILSGQIYARLFAAFATMATLFAAPAHAHEYKSGDLVIDHPWTRATPAGAKVAAGFVTITNSGEASDKLIGGSLATAKKLELHKMSVTDGVMTMGEVKGGIDIPSGQTVTLKPGGLHMMLMGLSAQPTQGERIKGTLVFEKAGKLDVEFAVEALGAKAPAGAKEKKHDHKSTPHTDHHHH